MKFSKLSTYKARKILTMFSKDIYPNNLKNWFSTASALPQNDCPCSCLASRQWSLAPDKNFEEPPGQIPNFSSFLGIKPEVERCRRAQAAVRRRQKNNFSVSKTLHPRLLKNWISLSCCFAAESVEKVPKFLRFPVFGFLFRE